MVDDIRRRKMIPQQRRSLSGEWSDYWYTYMYMYGDIVPFLFECELKQTLDPPHKRFQPSSFAIVNLPNVVELRTQFHQSSSCLMWGPLPLTLIDLVDLLTCCLLLQIWSCTQDPQRCSIIFPCIWPWCWGARATNPRHGASRFQVGKHEKTVMITDQDRIKMFLNRAWWAFIELWQSESAII
jgi:hypothetical protein